MKVSVVSDIHGNVEGLARVSESAEQLVVLGDLLDYIDYSNPGGGVLGAIFGADRVSTMIRMRTAGDFDAYHSYDRQLWSELADPEATVDDVVAAQYGRMVAALGPNTLLTLGNVDVVHVWAAVAPEHLRLRDGELVELDGVRLGFIGGGAVRALPPDSPWKSFDRDYETFQSVLGTLSAVDVLCSHIPPKIADLRHDTVTGREEMYGPGLLEFIEARQPALALSGHIHHPRASRARLGSTHCVNVGFFKQTAVPFVFDTDDVRAC